MRFFVDILFKLLNWKTILTPIIFLLVTVTTGWYNTSSPIDLDEIAWIQDAQVYQRRLHTTWNTFDWDQTKYSMDWTSPDFRLFDQPHLVKYIYGFALSTANIDPWQNTNRESNLHLFIEQKNTGRYLLTDNASSTIFGSSTIEAIILCRWISALFGLTTLLIMFLFLTFKFSLMMSSLSLLLLTTNPTIFYNLHLATSDSISLFFIVISLILFYLLFFKNHMPRKMIFLLFLLSAITSAFAVSTKINGWLLIYVFLLGQLRFVHYDRRMHWKTAITQTCWWFFLFLGSYLYLQPELWSSPFAGFVRFFSQRLTQQHQFVQSFGSLGFFEYHQWLVELSVQSKQSIVTISKVIFLLFALIKSIQLAITNFKKRYTFLKHTIVIMPVWLFFFYYSKVGFERYAIWPILIITLLGSWTITQQRTQPQ